MAANLRNNSFLSFLMLLLLIGSSYAITSSEMSGICDKTLNPSFCLKFLNPKFASPNLEALAKTTLDSTQSRAKQTLKRLQSIIDGGVDPRSKLAYRSCVDEYESAIGNLEEAYEHLASGDGMGMNMKVSAALDGADSCLDDVKRLRSVDASVVNNSKAIKNICGQEDYNRLRPSSYRGADAIILAFSLISKASYERMCPMKWILELKHSVPGVPIVLVCTKLERRQIAWDMEREEGRKEACGKETDQLFHPLLVYLYSF